ncbi:hypothetical protein C5167_008811 [Papaver somniferum]|uniref:Uncharacterized protein n=1 Tax=Papaver somniferum TaxID=3469 RepID=A0A4Y7JYQ2_PAPSO|nr:hypothetical protein C5167_008811 [Papaver somniferum]
MDQNGVVENSKVRSFLASVNAYSSSFHAFDSYAAELLLDSYLHPVIGRSMIKCEWVVEHLIDEAKDSIRLI